MLVFVSIHSRLLILFDVTVHVGLRQTNKPTPIFNILFFEIQNFYSTLWIIIKHWIIIRKGHWTASSHVAWIEMNTIFVWSLCLFQFIALTRRFCKLKVTLVETKLMCKFDKTSLGKNWVHQSIAYTTRKFLGVFIFLDLRLLHSKVPWYDMFKAIVKLV